MIRVAALLRLAFSPHEVHCSGYNKNGDDSWFSQGAMTQVIVPRNNSTGARLFKLVYGTQYTVYRLLHCIVLMSMYSGKVEFCFCLGFISKFNLCANTTVIPPPQHTHQCNIHTQGLRQLALQTAQISDCRTNTYFWTHHIDTTITHIIYSVRYATHMQSSVSIGSRSACWRQNGRPLYSGSDGLHCSSSVAAMHS